MSLFTSIYFIQILYILVCGFVFKNSKRRFLIAAFIALFVLMAFRSAAKIGFDSATSYYGEFLNIQNIGYKWPNPGLPFVMKTIHRFTGDYQWVIIITAAFVCFAYYKLLVKYSENGLVSVMWFMGMLFYTFMFSALKQACAMAFLCFAFDALLEKKIIRYLVFVFLATLFHFPALIFLPAFWIAKLKIDKLFPIIMFSLFAFVFVFRSRILNMMNETYGSGETKYSSNVQFLGTKVIFMILMLAYGFFQYYNRNYNKNHEANQFSTLMYFMGIAAVIQTFCFYNNIFERLADYYYQFSILFVPLIISSKQYDSKKTKNGKPQTSNAAGSGEVLLQDGLAKYSVGNVDIGIVIYAVITVFCIYRYVTYMINDAHFSPFYFFWQ